MDYKQFSAKTVDDAITEACKEFLVTSDRLDYEVKEEGSSGFLGIGAKPAIILAKVKEEEKPKTACKKAEAPKAEAKKEVAPAKKGCCRKK